MRILLCFFALALGVVTARAAATTVTIERRNSFNQEPNGSGYFISTDFYATVETTAASDYDAFALVGPAPADVPQSLTKSGAVHRFAAWAGSDPEEQLVNFPLGSYTFSSTGGVLGADSVTLVDSAPAFTGAPFFGNFAEYENQVEGQPVSIQVSGFPPRAGSTQNRATYALYEDDGLGHFVQLTSGVHEGGDPFSFGVGAGVTRADRVYFFGVEFHSDIVIPNAGLGGATGVISSVGANGSSFHVLAVPEPAAIALVTSSCALFAPLRRRR